MKPCVKKYKERNAINNFNLHIFLFFIVGLHYHYFFRVLHTEQSDSVSCRFIVESTYNLGPVPTSVVYNTVLTQRVIPCVIRLLRLAGGEKK